MKIERSKDFSNGSVFSIKLDDGMLIETTSTYLPFYTRDAIGRHQNFLETDDLGSRSERWMIGVSVMSGCPVGCKFCATGTMKRSRNLTAQEIVDQVEFMIERDGFDPKNSKEFKINYTRMGEPFLNIENVKEAIQIISAKYPNTHHYVSTVGIKGSDYSWIKGNITLQLSIHSFDDDARHWLIPYRRTASMEELSKIRTESNLKTTINLTLVDQSDFDIDGLKRYFPKEHFFVKISPINPNDVSESNNLGKGIIEGVNLV